MVNVKEYGYVRVSTKEQNEARQIIAMREWGIVDKNIYCDKQSGRNFERSAYQKLTKKLKPGDLMVVTSLDRLGRNYDEILEQWRIITKEKKADIYIIDMPLLDTRKKNDLTGALISDIVLQLLSYVAQTEREFIRKRQKEGIHAAKLRGVKFGRPELKKPDDFQNVFLRWTSKEINSRQAAELLKVSQVTFLKWGREIVETNKSENKCRL